MESRRLGYINGVHSVVRYTENFRTLESHNLPRELLLTWICFSCFDIQSVSACIGEHIVHLQIPSSRLDFSLVEEHLLRFSIIDEHALVLIDQDDFGLVS